MTPPTRPQAGRLFDHGGTVFFSLFMALWAVLFLEYWKRKSATLAYRWGCSDYEDIEVGCRPACGRSPRGPLLSTGSLLGEAAAPVCRLGPHDGPEPHHWRGRALLPREEPPAPRAGWLRGGRDDGEGAASPPTPLRRPSILQSRVQQLSSPFPLWGQGLMPALTQKTLTAIQKSPLCLDSREWPG